MAHVLGIWHRSLDLAVLEDTHHNGTATMSARVLCEVVTAGKFLAALVAFEWLVVGMEGAIVTLEVFLATEATRAKSAYEGLGWVFGERLLAASAVDRGRSVTAVLRVGSTGIAIVRAWLTLRSS